MRAILSCKAVVSSTLAIQWAIIAREGQRFWSDHTSSDSPLGSFSYAIQVDLSTPSNPLELPKLSMNCWACVSTLFSHSTRLLEQWDTPSLSRRSLDQMIRLPPDDSLSPVSDTLRLILLCNTGWSKHPLEPPLSCQNSQCTVESAHALHFPLDSSPWTKRHTVDSLLTHTSRDSPKDMQYEGVWVLQEGGNKCLKMCVLTLRLSSNTKHDSTITTIYEQNSQ